MRILAREEVLVEIGSILTSDKSHYVQGSPFDELPIPQDVTPPERCCCSTPARIEAVGFISSHAWEGYIELNPLPITG